MLIVKNGHQKDTCYIEIAQCVENKDIILGLVAYTSGKPYLIFKKERQKNFHFDLVQLLHLNYDFDT